MIARPRLKSYLTIYPLSDKSWGLQGGTEEAWRISLDDQESIRAFTVLLNYLDGKHSTESIIEVASSEGVDPEVARRLLSALEKNSFIEDVDDAGLAPEELSVFSEQVRYFSRFSSQGGAVLQARLKSCSVGVAGVNGIAESVRQLLVRSGFGSVCELDLLDSAATRPDFFVVALMSHDPLLLEAADSFAKKYRIPWMLVWAPNPREGWVGPMFIPGETASYASLEGRLRGAMANFESYIAFDNHVRASGKTQNTGALAVTCELLGSIAVSEIVKFITGVSVPKLAGRFLTIDLFEWNTEIHEVLKIPRLEADPDRAPTPYAYKEASFVAKDRRG